MSSKVYKWCAVPQCKNTTIKTPRKVFVYVPRKKTLRYKWLNLARRDPTVVCLTSPMHFCLDHFDLPNDMENYMQYHVMGSVSQVRMKPGCFPTKFECQSDSSQMISTIEQPYIFKKRRMMAVEECEKDFEERSMVTKYLDSGQTPIRISDPEFKPCDLDIKLENVSECNTTDESIEIKVPGPHSISQLHSYSTKVSSSHLPLMSEMTIKEEVDNTSNSMNGDINYFVDVKDWSGIHIKKEHSLVDHEDLIGSDIKEDTAGFHVDIKEETCKLENSYSELHTTCDIEIKEESQLNDICREQLQCGKKNYLTGKVKKTNAQRMREYRERKKLNQVRPPNSSSQEMSTFKRTGAQRMREYRERKKLMQAYLSTNSSQETRKVPKTNAQRVREYRERKKLSNTGSSTSSGQETRGDEIQQSS